jgi:hypothetical protein
MPACFAHYQFGQDFLARLGGDIKSLALTFKREFDSGLQGPDIFFFSRPYRGNAVRDYGVERHNQPAVMMFAPILEKAREKAALSYALGLICHYVLDKGCHPYVYGHTGDSYGHARMESAFDRYIMAGRGVSKARYRCLPAGGLDCASMASLWPDIDADTIRKCARSERRAIRVLDHGKLLKTCEWLARKPGALTPMTLPEAVSGFYAEHVKNLYALYEKALDECAGLIRTALGSMGAALTHLPGFDLNYKGNACE